MQNTETFGDFIQERLDSYGMTVTELSRRSGISRSTIYMLLRNEGNPTEKTMRKLTDALTIESKLRWSPGTLGGKYGV